MYVTLMYDHDHISNIFDLHDSDGIDFRTSFN